MTDVQSAKHLTVSSHVSSSKSAPVILELKQVTKIFRMELPRIWRVGEEKCGMLMSPPQNRVNSTLTLPALVESGREICRNFPLSWKTIHQLVNATRSDQ